MIFKPRRRFGQNFLRDQLVIDQILASINPCPRQLVIEIGPGEGALTGGLLEAGLHLAAIEIDHDLFQHLKQRFAGYDNFFLYNEDALRLNYKQLIAKLVADVNPIAPDKKVRLLGNLPYNIATQLVVYLLQYSPYIEDMHLMFQREVAQRLSAEPHSSAWGRLSVLVQYYGTVLSLFDVPASAFYPQPEVESSFVQFSFTEPAEKVNDMQQFQSLLQQAFGTRRKTVGNSLKKLFSKQQLQQLDIDSGLRAENLSLETYIKLSNYLSQSRGQPS